MAGKDEAERPEINDIFTQLNSNENSEAKSNLVGFFDLLMKIDKRKNPQLYEVANPAK